MAVKNSAVPETVENNPQNSRLNDLMQKFDSFCKTQTYKLTFVYGLPLMQGIMCKVKSTPGEIIIEAQGTVFKLDKSKIASITIEKNISTHTQTYSSAGGALAGAIMFGAVGAAIGGRAKTKQITEKKKYIVITYSDNENSVKNIIFDYNGGVGLVLDFKASPKLSVTGNTVQL